MTPEFVKFPSIPRLVRQCIVTEKIDGTNAVIHVAEDGTITAGSRNRWVTVEDDNYGFAAWAKEHAAELVALGPGLHHGEWWGKGINRAYGLDHRRFSLFNVRRWHAEGGTPLIMQSSNPKEPPKFSLDAPRCCHVVPVLWHGDLFSNGADVPVANVLIDLLKGGSVAAPGYDNPEGVVVYHEASGHMYKWTLGGDGHKGGRKR